MYSWFYLTVIFALYAKLCNGQGGDDIDMHPDIDVLLSELDKIVENVHDLKSIPDDLRYKCQLALGLWSFDGREDNDYPPSTPQQHANADRLVDKIRQTHLSLGGSEFDREGFRRDLFILKHQWMVLATQYYTFIKYYDEPSNPSYIFKLFQWTVYTIDSPNEFALMYHLERSPSVDSGYTYVLGRKIHPYYHESLIHFGNSYPSYMTLKTLIIDDIMGDKRLAAIASSGYYFE
ncbi:unnamed protein product [Adineta steineri]|uniref:Uncharacterized protein n=1 Tax=Adineta steineri TaxID=433720 RepID=A0A819ZG63_9BILA|nr:unnamed protein product [Adineta steineri]CAF0800539.1 unnamed protein product [Adineta steineri]CAF0846821.1 unnamed protein product [Adineta steineri]CAF3793272.1 unnamed protein product [Adineta steineri]CAF4176529.1 unnamed protein product [Adineta steineri]